MITPPSRGDALYEHGAVFLFFVEERRTSSSLVQVVRRPYGAVCCERRGGERKYLAPGPPFGLGAVCCERRGGERKYIDLGRSMARALHVSTLTWAAAWPGRGMLRAHGRRA